MGDDEHAADAAYSVPLDTTFCTCTQFALWYGPETSRLKICTCGHSDVEHLDGNGACVGDVTILKGNGDDSGNPEG